LIVIMSQWYVMIGWHCISRKLSTYSTLCALHFLTREKIQYFCRSEMVKAEYDKHASCSLLIFGIIFGIIEMLKDLLIKMIIIVMSAQLVRICCTIKDKQT